MPESKRPDPKRRSPASRPGKPGGANRGRPKGTSTQRREPRAIEAKPASEQQDTESVGHAIVRQAERIAEVMALFDLVVESSRIGVRKPEPEFYATACRVAGCDPSRIALRAHRSR